MRPLRYTHLSAILRLVFPFIAAGKPSWSQGSAANPLHASAVDSPPLFIPAASQNSLAGTLFLSTYPMFILGQEWLTHGPDGRQGEKLPHFGFPGASQ